MNADARIRTLGHDFLAVSQENLYSVEKPTHLPECSCAHQTEPSNHWHDHGAACEGCICRPLRACAQRILDEAINAAQDQHMYMSDQPLIVTGFNVAKSEILRAIRALEDTP